MKYHHANQSAFTLVELLVAISITIIMLVAISGVFTTASTAIGNGVGASDIIANSRAINDQITRDFENMVGPQGDGFLVIVQRLITEDDDTDNNASDAGVPVTAADLDTGYQTPVRSDQIVFIRSASDLEPLAPGAPNSYSNSVTAPHARVWYGHALRTYPNGFADPTDTDVRLGAGPNLGAPDNTLAANWILGRQALFLVDDPGNAFAHAENGRYNAAIDTAAGFGYENSINITPTTLVMGLHDVADQNLVGPTNSGVPGIIEELVAGSYNAATVHDYTFAKERLRVNPTPAGGAFESWQIAQMHPYFAGHISDFIVEFAGDYEDNVSGTATPDGLIDTDADQPSSTDINSISYDYEGGNIKWYTSGPDYPFTYPGREENFLVNDPADAANYDSSKPATYLLQAGAFQTAQSTPPNEFYYNATADGATTLAGLDNAHASFVWRHDDDGVALPSKWPHLIRIRYRLHDPQGNVVGPGGDPGMWFELILPVKRPGQIF